MRIGKKLTEIHKENISKGLKRMYKEGTRIHHQLGKPISKEHKKKLTFKGRKHTKETRKRISESQKGRIFSEEHIQKMRKPKSNTDNMRKSLSKEHKLNLSLSKMGKLNPKSSETLKRLFKEGKLKPNMLSITGEKHPSWKGGKSFEPYTKDFNKRFKKLIKERDGRCMMCNSNLEILKELKRWIHIHHIDYDKKNSFPQNCVTLCNSCHSITNANRTSWKLFFQDLLKKEYNYEYTLDQKIILDFNGGSNNDKRIYI